MGGDRFTLFLNYFFYQVLKGACCGRVEVMNHTPNANATQNAYGYGVNSTETGKFNVTVSNIRTSLRELHPSKPVVVCKWYSVVCNHYVIGMYVCMYYCDYR